MSDLFEQGHACVIGVGGDLPSTVDDAKGFAKILKDPERCAYPVDQVKVLTGENATRANIINALETLASTTDAESTVLVYFSGHGYQLSGAIKSYFLMPYGYDSKDLLGTAISDSEFVRLLRAIPAQKLLVLLDCCHAGGLIDLDGFQVAKAPLPPEATKKFTEGGGRMIIASSKPNERSFAAKPFSVFTYALIKGLSGEGAVEKDGYIRAADLAMYASRIVPSETDDKQHPVLDIQRADNFVLAYYAGGDKQPKSLPKELEQPLEVDKDEYSIDSTRIYAPTPESPKLLGFLVDVSHSMTCSTNNLQSRFDDFRKEFRRILDRASGNSDEEQKNSHKFFILAFGSLSWDAIYKGGSVRDLLKVDSSVSLKQLEEDWSKYEKQIEKMFKNHIGFTTPLVKALRLSQKRFEAELGKPPYKIQPILFILSDGEPTDNESNEAVQIARKLKQDGILIICCYLTNVDIVEPRYLYSAPHDEWDEGAKLMFNCASILSPESSPYFTKELKWKIQSQENSKLFAQINHSEYLSEYIGVINRLTP
jgi:hypothetical protein